MKKLIYSILGLLLFPFTGFAADEAGAPSAVWTYPVVYNYTEQISWYFDLSGTTFAENEDLYLWAWSPSEPDAGNWENSSDFAKLTYVGDKVWRMDMTPTKYFSKTPEEIAASAGFWMRLKNKTGSKQSDVIQVSVVDYSGFATSGNPYAFYPAKFYINAPLSILFNTAAVDGFKDATDIHFHSGLNDWDVKQEYQAWLPDVVAKTKLKDLGNGIYKIDMIPAEYYDTPEGYVMSSMNFLFVKGDWALTSPDYKVYAPDVPIPPPAELSFFPLKISVKDIFIITRKYNDKGQQLSYTITGGSKTITGNLSGNMDQQRAFVNIAGEFKGMDISKLVVTISDQTNKIIFTGDIPLVTIDKPNK